MLRVSVVCTRGHLKPGSTVVDWRGAMYNVLTDILGMVTIYVETVHLCTEVIMDFGTV